MNICSLQTGPFGINTWIVPLCGNRVLVFDPGACSFTKDSHKITGFLSENNLDPVAFVLTHGHFDHITGTGVLKNAYPEVPLVCHEKDCVMIGHNAVSVQMPALSVMGLELIVHALENLPDADITFSCDTTLDKLIKTSDQLLQKELSFWKGICTPGHTPGSVCWYNSREKILMSGDTIFYHSWGRTDLPGGNEGDIIKSLKMINEKIPSDTKVYPGHDYAGFTLQENQY